MMEMVKSAVVDEAVSGIISLAIGGHEVKASQEDLMDRLLMAHLNLESALVRTRMMPITIMPLLRKKKWLMGALEECDDLLRKARDRLHEVPSLRRKVMHAVLPYFIFAHQDVLSSSAVAKFERYVKEARKFTKDVESGCSPSRYRFHNPLIRNLLEGKSVSYHMVQGSQTWSFWIYTTFVEEYGRVARLAFLYQDREAPLKSIELELALRLYESTNIVGVAEKCLQSLGPQFKSLAEVVTGELTRIPTQDNTYYGSVNSVSWDQFPQEVMMVHFHCSFSASEYCSRSSTHEAHINATKSWPPLQMRAIFAPHQSAKYPDTYSLHQTEEGIPAEAIDYFIRHPKLTEHYMFWDSRHGCAIFKVLKPITKTRRRSKRSR